jgi:hypothetical protein
MKLPGDEKGPCPCGHRDAMCHRANAARWCPLPASDRLRQALTSLEPLLSVRFDGTEDMVEHAEALAGLERAREIVARALRGEG